MVGEAVKVTGVPAQILFAEAAMLIEGVIGALTVPVTGTAWLVAPLVVKTTLPDTLPVEAEAADRT